MASSTNLQKKYRYAFRRLHEKYLRGEKIRVGFSVIFDSVFPLQHVFELMRADSMFDPFLIAIPDIARSTEHMLSTYIRTCASLEAQYPDARLVRTFSPKDSTLITDIVSLCDLYCPANPYDAMLPPPYRHAAFQKRSIPIFYTYYGTPISKAFIQYIRDNTFFADFWRFYAQAQVEADKLGMDNIRLSGIAKLDKMADIPIEPRQRKRIIIAPHHTIFPGGNIIAFGHFLHYADLLLRLPELFPQVDFVFRPHPLLKQNLQNPAAWGPEKTDAWFSAMAGHRNVELQEGGDYLTTFVNSDALIHDCGSFIVEYLFTDHPCCYMWDTRTDVFEQFSELGRECLEVHTIAKTEGQILDFITEVVIGGHDALKEKRAKVSARLKYNYPHCSQYILDDIRNEILDAHT